MGGWAVIVGTVLASGLWAAQAPPKPVVPEPVIEKPIPRAEFISRTNQPGFGRDPFFPGTLRFNPPKPKPEPVPPTPGPDPGPISKPPPSVVLNLNGIIGSMRAIINGQIFRTGEGGLIPDAKARIRVDEIKPKSVKVTLFLEDGKTEKRELFLKEQ